MYTAKHAMLYQHKVHGGESYVFYMDIRAGGKNYEEFVRRAIEEDGVNYVRGRVARIYEKNGKLIVKGVDTLLGASPVEIEADMVVLATAGVANKGAEELAQKMHISYDPYQFFARISPQTETGGNEYSRNLSGRSLSGVEDIPETAGMGSGSRCESSRIVFTGKSGSRAVDSRCQSYCSSVIQYLRRMFHVSDSLSLSGHRT